MTSVLSFDGQREATFRFDLLDSALAYQATLPVETTVTITNDTGRLIQRTSEITLAADVAAEIDLGHARVRASMVLPSRDPVVGVSAGEVIPIGTFVFVSDDRVRDSALTEFTGSLMDFGFLVDQQTVQSFGVPQGKVLSFVIEQILVAQGLNDFAVAATGVTAGADVGWPPGTSWMTIVNELAALQGCLPLYFDASGRGVVQLVPDLAVTPPAVVYEAGLNIFNTGIHETSNRLTAPNVFVVIETSASAEPIRGLYAVPATAPNSQYRRGVTIPMVIQEQGLQSSYQANDRARLLAITDGAVIDGRSFDGPPDPRHGTYSVIEFEGERYLEKSWSMICRDGENMSHTLSRIYGDTA